MSSGLGDTRVSKNGIDPLLLGTSVVNCICGSVELKWCRELLAVFHLLDDKGVINIPIQKPGWIGGSVNGFDSNSPINRLATMAQMGNPWLYHRSLHNTYLGRGNRYIFQAEFQQCGDVLHGHGGPAS